MFSQLDFRTLHATSDKDSSQTFDEATSVTYKPPLVMYSSNLLLNNRLDNKHGGGGVETSEFQTGKSFKKKFHVDLEDPESSDKVGNTAKSAGDQSNNHQKLIVSHESASNPSVKSQNDEENGIMEFEISDESKSDVDVNNFDESPISTDEIDALLEESFNRALAKEGKDVGYKEVEKLIIKARGRNGLDILPQGWVEICHNSGIPVYLHRPSRICTLSRPYYLGAGSARKHEIPVSAIPCLQYLRELEKEKTSETISRDTTEESSESNNSAGASNNSEVTSNVDKENKFDVEMANGNPASKGIFQSAKIEIDKDTKVPEYLDILQVREYCQKRFEFETIPVKCFKSRTEKRRHMRERKREQQPYPHANTKLIRCSKVASDGTKKEIILNPSGRTPVCILTQYVQHTLGVTPKYVFKVLEDAMVQYEAIVYIDKVEYGSGFGNSKKRAKHDAAKSTLELFIPKLRMLSSDKESGDEHQDVDLFDEVPVEDPRVCELSVEAGQPYPYQILLECLKRNYGMGDTEIEGMLNNIEYRKNEFYMRVGKHEISVVCKDKSDGRHRASQTILQRLHPHINSWGSILRLYGRGSYKTMREKKESQLKITELANDEYVGGLNISLINKLKEDMLKYREKVKSKKPDGKLFPERMKLISAYS